MRIRIRKALLALLAIGGLVTAAACGGGGSDPGNCSITQSIAENSHDNQQNAACFGRAGNGPSADGNISGGGIDVENPVDSNNPTTTTTENAPTTTTTTTTTNNPPASLTKALAGFATVTDCRPASSPSCGP